jgi:hypothetical protein
MNNLKNLRLSYKLSFPVVVLSLFCAIFFYSCEKDINAPQDTTDRGMAIQASFKIMKFNSFDEYLETKKKVLQMTFEELQAFEDSKSFISQGRAEDQFYYSIDPESFQNIDELREFVAKNSKFVKLVYDEDGEYQVMTLHNENSDRYFMNIDGVFQVGERLYKVLDWTTKLSTNNENFDKLEGFSIDNYTSKLSSDFIVSKTEKMRYEDENSLTLKDAAYNCGTDFRKLQKNGKNRTELKGWIYYSHDWDVTIDPNNPIPFTVLYNMVQIKNQKRSAAWFNASRTTTYDLAIAFDLGNERYEKYESGTKKFAKKQFDLGGGVISFGYHSTLPLHYGGYDCYVKTPSIDAINKKCNASLL